MLSNTNNRETYLGFNDFWFVVVGSLILSIVTTYLFNNNILDFRPIEAIVNWLVSLFFTVFNWFIIRTIIIKLRKHFPGGKDDIKRALILFVSIVLTVLFVDMVGNRILSFVFQSNYTVLSKSKIIVPIIIISTMTMAIYEAIYFSIRLRESTREEEKAKQIMVQAQLDALSNQAQPHFFFNTLNTLRDIIDQNSKEDAKVFVDKLSDVYRFILESGTSNTASVKDELAFAQAYIHIQKERFGSNLTVHWEIPESHLDRLVVPMSIQLLLENAIKHNIVSKNKPLSIRVSVIDNDLQVTNNLQLKSTKLPSTQMGLKNIKERYHLIASRTIDINQTETEFTVSLPLLNQSDLR